MLFICLTFFSSAIFHFQSVFFFSTLIFCFQLLFWFFMLSFHFKQFFIFGSAVAEKTQTEADMAWEGCINQFPRRLRSRPEKVSFPKLQSVAEVCSWNTPESIRLWFSDLRTRCRCPQLHPPPITATRSTYRFNCALVPLLSLNQKAVVFISCLQSSRLTGNLFLL